MEEEREKMRKGIRDKVQIMSRDQQVDFLIIFHYYLIQYNIKKIEEFDIFNMPEIEGSLNRQKKSQTDLDEEGNLN